MRSEHIGEFEQAQRLESGLVWVRYFAVVLGAYLISQSNAGPLPHASSTVLLVGQVLMAILAGGNVLISGCGDAVQDLRPHQDGGGLHTFLQAVSHEFRTPGPGGGGTTAPADGCRRARPAGVLRPGSGWRIFAPR
ncbi:MAG TPA: hypothetical protein VEM93_10695 [Actinomycetota bacterium]|nr:hypothetical protein [Actinomycetota bacterium]